MFCLLAFGGNILSRKEYPYTPYADEASGTPIETVTYEYGDNDWGDLLTKVGGMTATYDKIGNLTKLGNLESYTWEHGRELASQTASAELAILTQPSDCKGVAGAEAKFSITATCENLT